MDKATLENLHLYKGKTITDIVFKKERHFDSSEKIILSFSDGSTLSIESVSYEDSGLEITLK